MIIQPTRRTFVQGSALAAMGALGACAPSSGDAPAPGAGASEEDPLYITAIGAQLYTVRALFEADPQATLAALAGIGIKDCETAGLFDHSASDIRAMMDDLGLISRSGHIRLETLRDDREFAAVLEDAALLGQDRLYLGWIAPEERGGDQYRALAALLNRRGEQAKAAGLMVGYHNHEFEFIEEGGTTGYDILLSQTDPEFVTMELDLYWVADAGKDALEIFNSAPDRFSAVHIKDRTPSGDMAPAGDGEIDFAQVLPDALAKGVERFYIEHDNPADPLVSVGRSYTHLMAALPR